MTLRIRIQLGFMAMAALVAINGVSGIVAVSGISETANGLINGKFETQRLSADARLSTQKALALSRAYVSRSDAYMNIEIALANELQASSTAIRSIDEPELAKVTGAALGHQGAFEEAMRQLIESHKLASAYTFEVESVRYDVSSFVEHVAFSLSIWWRELESAFASRKRFDGNLDASRSAYARWASSFDTKDEELAALAADFGRTNEELHEEATRLLAES
ncbi:MAG: hypothetical protein ACR2RL_13130, partial [Gammaproteobacteria bacterium]